jgi:hypothetical protein
MKSLKLSFKTTLIACLAFFLSNNFSTAQSPMYVSHRIESEILKSEIQKLDIKDPAYKTKLAELQKKEAAFSAKATTLEDAIFMALEAEKKNPNISPTKISYDGINLEMKNIAGAVEAVRPPPSPRPCQGGGLCQDFFIFAQKCDWASAKSVRQITVNGTVSYLFFIVGLSGQFSTERHIISSKSEFSRN